MPRFSYGLIKQYIDAPLLQLLRINYYSCVEFCHQIFNFPSHETTKFITGLQYNRHVINNDWLYREVKIAVKVYLDAFFLVNFIMDFIVLKTTMTLLECYCKWVRLGIASAFGAVWSVVALIFIMKFQKYKVFVCLITYTVVAAIMLFIVLGQKALIKLPRAIVVLYVVTFALAGICFGIWNYTAFGYAWISGMIRKEQVVLGVTLFLLVKFILKRIIYVRKKYNSAIYKVCLQVMGKTVVFNGLLDTGNVLVDPFTGRIVHIVKSDVLSDLLAGENDLTRLHYRLVPYNSVGQAHGLLPVIDVDCMEVYECNKVIFKGDAAIGIYEGKLTGNGHYEGLLNAAVFKN